MKRLASGFCFRHHTPAREPARAIRDAFVRLLAEKPYAQVTIREIVLVAGVGLGSFYEYFDSKDALARACVHLRTKELLRVLARRRGDLGRYTLAEGIAAAGGSWRYTLAEGIAAAVGSQAAIYAAAPDEWAQHFLLERQKSDLKYYLAAYEDFVAEWRALVEGATDWRQDRSADEAARLAFTLVYGGFAHGLMRGRPPLDTLRRDLTRAALACLAAR